MAAFCQGDVITLRDVVTTLSAQMPPSVEIEQSDM